MTETMGRVDAAAVEFTRCPGCGAMTYWPRLARALNVFPCCRLHAPVPAPQRLEQLLDPGSFSPIQPSEVWRDPLGFHDTKPYERRLNEARLHTGLSEAVVCGDGTIEGNPVVVAVMDFRFLGGSLGAGVGERITSAAERALQTRTPLVLVTASGGARMQEGAISLMQMVKTSQAMYQLDQTGILTISVITDPTFGGVAASFATLSNIIIAEPGARLGFAGPRVIEQTIRQRLPEGLQTAEFLHRRGFVDMIRPRAALRPTLSRLLTVRSGRAGTPTPARSGTVAEPFVTDPARLPDTDAWTSVRAARDLRRPTAREYFEHMLGDFVELHGDRLSGDCSAVVGGLGQLGSQWVVVIGHQKGHDGAELARRGYGMPTPAGYRKCARLMRLAAKLGLPVVTLVDTPGAYPGVEAEEQGQAFAVAECVQLMAGLPVPTVTVVTGEGGSGGALALAVADRVLMCANATYSVISPEGCAAILWKDAAEAPRAADALRVGARDLLDLGVVSGVVPEPEGGAGADPYEAMCLVADAVTHAMTELLAHDSTELMFNRHRRFRRYGLTPEEKYTCPDPD